MKYRNWGVALIICLLSLGLLCIYMKQNTTLVTDHTLTTTRGVCYTIPELEVQKLVYKWGDESITIIRQDGHFLLEDVETETFIAADERYIYKLLDQFAAPVYEEVVRIAPSHLASYGITSASQTMTLFDKENKAYTLVRGNEDFVYLAHADTIYKISSRPFDLLTLDRDAWISKQLISFNINDVQSIDLEYKTLYTTLIPKEGENGLFTNEILGDDVATDFVRFLETTEADTLITANANAYALSAYGFDQPNLRCTLYFKNREPVQITIGRIEPNENKCYAMVNHNNKIVSIPFFEFFSRSLYTALDNAENGDVLF